MDPRQREAHARRLVHPECKHRQTLYIHCVKNMCVYVRGPAVRSIPQEADQGERSSVGRFREGGNRHGVMIAGVIIP